MRLKFSEYSDIIIDKFSNDEEKFKAFSKVCVDVCKGERYLEGYSKETANAMIASTIRGIAGLSEQPTKREVDKALRKTAVREAIFEILEDTIEDTLVSGWSTDPFFNKYVEVRNKALGDTDIFYTKDPSIITISKIADGHHDLERQRLGAGREFRVSTSSYGAKVYMELGRYLQGVEDWTDLVAHISIALTRLVNTTVHEAVMSAGSSLPSPTQWNVRGLLTPAKHDDFVKLIQDVQLATGSEVTIIGTKVALAGLRNLGDVDWVSNEAKSDVYRMGRIGTFEGTPLVELPQAFAPNDTSRYLEDDTKLLLMPNSIDQFVKLYYEGNTSIVENTEAGKHQDDTMDYELKTTFGVTTMTNVRFGTWTIGA